MGSCGAKPTQALLDHNKDHNDELKDDEPHRRSISMARLKRQNSMTLKAGKPILNETKKPTSGATGFEKVEVNVRGSWVAGAREPSSGSITLDSGSKLTKDKVAGLEADDKIRLSYDIGDDVRIPLQYGKDAGRVLKAMVLRKDRDDGTYWVRIQTSKLSEKRGHVNKIIKVEHTHLLSTDAYKKQRKEKKLDNVESLDSSMMDAASQEGGSAEANTPEDAEDDNDDSNLSQPVDVSDATPNMEVPSMPADSPDGEGDDDDEARRKRGEITRQITTTIVERPGENAREIASATHSDLSE